MKVALKPAQTTFAAGWPNPFTGVVTPGDPVYREPSIHDLTGKRRLLPPEILEVRKRHDAGESFIDIASLLRSSRWTVADAYYGRGVYEQYNKDGADHG